MGFVRYGDESEKATVDRGLYREARGARGATLLLVLGSGVIKCGCKYGIGPLTWSSTRSKDKHENSVVSHGSNRRSFVCTW